LKSRHIAFLIVLALVLVSASLWAATVEEIVADVVANSGVFPAGTSVVNVAVDGSSVTVELSPEAAPADLGDSQVDEMTKALMNALHENGITALEITVGGKPLWQYLPGVSAVPSSEGGVSAQSLSVSSLTGSGASGGATIGLTSIGGGGGEGANLPVLTTELAGKNVALHPSHGMYWHQSYNRWFIAMRTLCGPNPVTKPPGWDPLWQSTYQPSDYYYYTRNFQWPSFYEDHRTPQEIRFLRAYLETSGANVVVSRNLDKTAGDFDYNRYGYPNCSFPIPKWMVAAKYNLQDIGAPEAVWNEPSLTAQTDKDIRARPYWANYNMLGWWHYPLTQAEKDAIKNNTQLWQNWISISLHTNASTSAGGQAQARGTETYWYTSSYPWLQTKAQQLAAAFLNGVVNAIWYEYDGFWADAMYDASKDPVPPEWYVPYGTYRGYQHAGGSLYRWQNRGVKTSNFGEIREALMPAVLMEMLFHDDWKFYPDHVFALDEIFQSTVAWGMYEGICNYWGITPKPRLAATVAEVNFPSGYVAPGATVNGTVSMLNRGMAWCWGHKTSTENWPVSIYFPYTVWKLRATENDQVAPGTKIEISQGAPIYPGQTATFNVSLTAPLASGTYTTEWQMLKDDAFGGAFGEVATAQIKVDADPPVITINAPVGDNPYGCQTVAFDATDELSGVASISADIDGSPVSNGQKVCGLALGPHTLTVTATDNVGNTATQSVTFNVVNTVGKTTAGGWIELANKKGTCGFVSEYVEGAPAPTGSLTYQDHDTGMTVKSIDLVAMGIVGNSATIFGTCNIDNQPGHWFRVDVVDNGEPGSSDLFFITLDTGYAQGGVLGGGNVVIH